MARIDKGMLKSRRKSGFGRLVSCNGHVMHHWRRVAMLELLDRCRTDSTLFQFTTKQLRDFIDPNHLLIQIDEELDFAKLGCALGGAIQPRFRQTGDPPECDG